MATCKWPLGNGENLEFTIYDSSTTWNNVAGLYIFARSDGQRWYALYVGQTDDFRSRLPNHERWDEARRNGATAVHAVVVSQAGTRDKLEKLLIRHLRPPLNDQLL